MGRMAYNKCIVIMKDIRRKWEYEVPIKEIIKIIKIKIGADQRTIENYIELLREFGFIQLKGYGIYQIIEKKEEKELY